MIQGQGPRIIYSVPAATRRLLALGLAASTLVFAACGGPSTADDPPRPNVVAYQTAISGWLEAWRQAGFADRDRDYAFCFGPSDPPVPASSPDPSGHSRARIPCPKAVGAIQEALPRYRELVTRLKGLTTTSPDPRINAAQAALVQLHADRLRLYEEAAAALNRGDEQTVAALRQRYAAQAEIEAAATQALAALFEKPK